MSIFARLRRLLRANIHDALDRAEDPAKVVNYLILEMQESMEQARQETATAMAAEKRLAQQADDAEEAARQWEGRARGAVERGNDDLAREALYRQTTALGMAAHYRQAHQEQVHAVNELRSALDRLQQRLQEAKVRRATLLAQLDAARAQQVVARTMRQTIGQEAFDSFDRLAGQIAASKHKATALLELSRDEAEDAFVVAEAADIVEHQLEAMKRDAGALDGPGEMKALEEPEHP